MFFRKLGDEMTDLAKQLSEKQEHGYICIIWAHRTPNGIPRFDKQFIPADFATVARHIEWKFGHTDAQDYTLVAPSEAD